MIGLKSRFLTGGVVALVTALAPAARAQNVKCSDLIAADPSHTLVLMTGDTQEPLLKRIGYLLRNPSGNTKKVTILYQKAPSCDLLASMYNQDGALLTPTATSKQVNYLPLSSDLDGGTWDPVKGKALTCAYTPGTDPQINASLGISALFTESCAGLTAPPTLSRVSGPVQAYMLAVPKDQMQSAITAEEAYFLLGWHQGTAATDGQVTPWTDDQSVFIRKESPATASTQLVWAANLGLDPNKMKGIQGQQSSDVLGGLTMAAANGKTGQAIGILGIDVVEANTDTVKGLAFQAFHQKHAYYPNQTATSRDKQNVRDGHYTVWSPTVYVYKKDAGGGGPDPNARYLIDLVLGNALATPPDFDPIDGVAAAGLVPDCAMKVRRAFDGGDLSLYTPAQPCGCYFDSKVRSQVPASCTACSASEPCASGTCRHGFCEAQ
jgi:hypothetical protein